MFIYIIAQIKSRGQHDRFAGILKKRFYEIQRSCPRHTYSMESQITFITIVSAWKHISREINEIARMLKMKQLMTLFTQFIKAYG